MEDVSTRAWNIVIESYLYSVLTCLVPFSRFIAFLIITKIRETNV
jgi:hypothetical protein